MRFSTHEPRDASQAIAVIHAALDAGATLLDTADAYCLHDGETGHNERLVAGALRTWSGDSSRIEVATKGGLTRPGGDWVPDGRAKHLVAACDASLRSLDVDSIDLYQLHVVDPRTPLETSVRALARLQREGKVQRIGLSNVTVGQIEAARRIAEIHTVQVSLSVLDDENLRNGVAEYCRDHGIRLIAYRPLGGGQRSGTLAHDPVLSAIAAEHGTTAQDIALAWLLDLDPSVVPIPGATRVETARRIRDVLDIAMTDDDRDRLDARFPSGKLLRVPRSRRSPVARAEGDVVLIMGMPGAGKSSIAEEYVARGYQRLNRDLHGGRLSDLVDDLDEGLAASRFRCVLDNTYPLRSSRNEVIECAWRHGVPVRCIWLTTSLADAQINAVSRLLELHGRLPSPEEIRARSKQDPRYFGPDAQFRYDRQLESPALDEGFASIEERTFTRRSDPRLKEKAVVLEFDGVLCTSASGAPAVLDPDDLRVPADRRATLRRYVNDGWRLLTIAWRPQLSRGGTSEDAAQACFARARNLLGLDIDGAYCPHPAGPPICWCRKPLPGLLLDFEFRCRVALEHSLLIGRAPADRTLAERLSMKYHDGRAFFRSTHR